MEVLEAAEWQARAAAHAARVDTFLRPHLARREDGVKHPVHDFLFTYYSHRPAQLRRWHPGHGVGLRDAPEHARLKGYVVSTGSTTEHGCSTTEDTGSTTEDTGSTTEHGCSTTGGPVVHVSDEHVAAQRPLVESLHALLSATAGRAPAFGCFGMHEWAMVYRLAEDETRHAAWPLRLGPDGTDAVVESHRVTCSHFDAYRFFTEPARPLNTLRPTSADRAAFEQPGCLHAGMDLYKHAFRLSPMIDSDLVADCFELAWDIRVLDMRAAPYDLTGLRLDHTGEEWTPVRVETPEGKQEYAARQREFTDRSQDLRRRLVLQCEQLLDVGPA
ncbi:3-methyladenine DNA glycosylase [Nocardioides sp. SYSU DS0663]|uniref:3-methyladenine DNA glycosylase n=1 Tax=Nocardioides sp. SYSU DS0663 TaxID=3416445 RepID=UPI003F4C4763